MKTRVAVIGIAVVYAALAAPAPHKDHWFQLKPSCPSSPMLGCGKLWIAKSSKNSVTVWCYKLRMAAAANYS